MGLQLNMSGQVSARVVLLGLMAGTTYAVVVLVGETGCDRALCVTEGYLTFICINHLPFVGSRKPPCQLGPGRRYLSKVN